MHSVYEIKKKQLRCVLKTKTFPIHYKQRKDPSLKLNRIHEKTQISIRMYYGISFWSIT